MHRSKKARREAIEMVNSILNIEENSRDPVHSSYVHHNTDNSFEDPFSSSDSHETFSDISSASSVTSNHIEDSNSTISNDLANWAVKHLIGFNALKDLLEILSKSIKDLPKDPRTLKKTPKDIVSTPLDTGEYFHYGVQDGLTDYLMHNMYKKTKIVLDFNVDGLPVAKSSSVQVWPILCNIVNTEYVFLIGAYTGTSKPENADDFMAVFISDLREIMEKGIIFNNTLYSITVRAFIFDAPARSFVLKTKGHTGYYPCIKCTTKGTLLSNKVTFPYDNSPLRTNNNFRSRAQTEHHNQQNPVTLELLDIDIVNQVPFDYMHVVCLGVTKTLLKMWIKSRGNSFSLVSWKIKLLDEKLKEIANQIPAEFSRHPRSLSDLDRWKATELRQFLLYTGPFILKHILDENRYTHFLKFSIGIRILLTEEDCITNNTCAHNLLVSFVKDVTYLYNAELLTFNFHCLTHLAADVMSLGCLENFSSFKYENYLHNLKKLVKKGNHISSQLYNRLVEKSINTTSSQKQTYPIFGKFDRTSFEFIQFEKFVISIKAPNNYYLSSENKIFKVRSINRKNNKPIFQSTQVENIHPYFNTPLNSSNFNIYFSETVPLRTSSQLIEHTTTEVHKKIAIFQSHHEKHSYLIPLIH